MFYGKRKAKEVELQTVEMRCSHCGYTFPVMASSLIHKAIGLRGWYYVSTSHDCSACKNICTVNPYKMSKRFMRLAGYL